MFERKIKLSAVIFSAVLTFGGTIFAQTINDDLKPSVSPAKLAAAVKSPVKPNVKASVKVTAKTRRKSGRQSKQTSGKADNAAAKPARSSDAYTFSAETPEQIINRYMSFQQSASVTVRDWKSVVVQTTKTLQEDPNQSTAKAQSLIAQGQIAYNERSYPMAASYFKSALQMLPASSLPKYSLGKVYLANGQAKAAEQAFKDAIDQNEGFALAYKGIGDALAAQGENKKAVKYYRKATEVSIRKGSLP